ncbi:Alpha/Beta hydrolase protein [Zopfochytrium polystomum]|nr:Alpha/Beta hydrolase protein [Zopfochytrium polystomum]
MHLLQLDIIRKSTGYRGRPVMIRIHGGGWRLGDKSGFITAFWHLASRENWIIVNINHRFSPTVGLFEILCDCKKALRWVRRNAQIHGGDPSFVAVSGSSSGAHLATLLALTQNDPVFQRGWEDVDTSVQLCIPLYAPFDALGSGQLRKRLVQMSDKESVRKTRRSVAGWADPLTVLRAVPLEARGSLPPFFVVHGAADTLVPVEQARSFVEEAGRGGKMVVAYAEVPGMNHAFDWFHHPAVLHLSWAMGCVLDAAYSERESRLKALE